MKINVHEMLDEMTYTKAGNQRTAKVVAVAHELQDRLDELMESSEHHTVNVNVSRYTLEVSIGNVQVWNSEINHENDLNAKACLGEFESEIRRLAQPFGGFFPKGVDE